MVMPAAWVAEGLFSIRTRLCLCCPQARFRNRFAPTCFLRQRRYTCPYTSNLQTYLNRRNELSFSFAFAVRCDCSTVQPFHRFSPFCIGPCYVCLSAMQVFTRSDSV